MTATTRTTPTGKAALLALLALAFSAGGAAPAMAQAGLLGRGAAYFGAGASGVATRELDDRLASRGYPTFGGSAAAVSLGAYRVLASGLMLGAEWHGLILDEKPHAGGEVGLGGGYGTLGVGYAFELSDRVRLYPRLGLGAGGMGLWIEVARPDTAFDDVLTDPRPSPDDDPVLSRGGPVVDLGAGVELQPSDGAGLLLGLRFGWLATPGAGWWLAGREVTGGPESSIAGAYARVAVGIVWNQ